MQREREKFLHNQALSNYIKLLLLRACLFQFMSSNFRFELFGFGFRRALAGNSCMMLRTRSTHVWSAQKMQRNRLMICVEMRMIHHPELHPANTPSKLSHDHIILEDYQRPQRLVRSGWLNTHKHSQHRQKTTATTTSAYKQTHRHIYIYIYTCNYICVH